MASYMLNRVLTKHGIPSKLIKGNYNGMYHWWVVVDNFVVDITATQFGMKDRVYITRASNKKYVGKEHQAKTFAQWPKRLWPTKFVSYFRGISIKE